MSSFNWNRLSRKNAVGWMHPSFRDLVIEHLVENGNERRAFLASCGADGIMLALSAAGGAKGDRSIPLLSNSADWDALTQRTRAIIAQGSSGSVSKILAASHELGTRKRQGSVVSPRDNTAASTTYIRSVLDVVRNRWDAKETVITIRDLSLYYSMSEMITPLPPSPNLSATWNAGSSSLKEEVDEHRSFEDVAFDEISEWLELVEVISANEPRFLRQARFPEDFLPQFDRLILYIEAHFKLRREPGTRSTCEELLTRSEEVRIMAKKMEDLVPPLNKRATSLRDSAEVECSRLQEFMDREFPEYERMTDDDYRPVGGFNLGELFEDL